MIIAGRSAAVLIRGKELDLVGDDVKRAALGTILCLVGAGLNGADNGNLSSLGQVATAELGELTPGDDVQEIRFLLTGLRIAKTAVHRNRKVANRNAGLRGSHFRVTGQVADQKNLIHILCFLLEFRLAICNYACSEAAVSVSSLTGATRAARGLTLLFFSSSLTI